MGGQARLQGQAIPTPVACTCMPDHEARLLGCATQDVDITLPPQPPLGEKVQRVMGYAGSPETWHQFLQGTGA